MKRGAGAKPVDLARRYGVSEATIYNWKSKYGGLEVYELGRLKDLESENAKLKRPLAGALLDQRIFWHKVLPPAARRKAVAHLQTHLGMSERRVCLGCDTGHVDLWLPCRSRTN